MPTLSERPPPAPGGRVNPTTRVDLEVRKWLRAGLVVQLGRSASVRFSGSSGFFFRIIRVDDKPTYSGWAWLDGYQLDSSGNAVERRNIFVQPNGLKVVPEGNRRTLARPRAPLRRARVPV